MGRNRRGGRGIAPSQGGSSGADVFFGGAAPVDRRAERKERQLCRQVHEAVATALAVLDDALLQDVWVADVEPAPDASRLAIVVEAPRGADVDEVHARLEKVVGYVRAEVAASITRKRAPTLTFRVVPHADEP